MSDLERIGSELPDAAKDIKLNLQAVLRDGALTDAQRWGVAYASALACRNRRLQQAIRDAALAKVDTTVLEDATAAAALMGMNNVYYRFRHMIAKPVYRQKPARLRMNRLVRPATSKADFELFSLAVSAIHGCETCVCSHEKVVLEGGLSEDAVHDAVRIAATVHAVAVALEGVPDVADPATAAIQLPA